MSAQHMLEPMAQVAEYFVFIVRHQPDGSRWPVGTQLYARSDLLALLAHRDELLAYAHCEDARSRGEDVAETVLKQHGFNPSECTANEFMDRMRRAAIAKATGKP